MTYNQAGSRFLKRDGNRGGAGRTARYEAEDLMRLEIENAEAGKLQRRYARLAGFLFLGEIIVALGGGLILCHVVGNGTFVETAKRIAGSEHLYRAARSTAVIATLSSAVLAFALYATLKPFNNLLSLLAVLFSLEIHSWPWWYGCAAS
jgi:hypothetical protein